MADETVQQIIAEIALEDQLSAAVSSARKKIREFRGEVELLDKALTQEEKAALKAKATAKQLAAAQKEASKAAKEHARELKQLSDRELRKAEQRMSGLKKGAEALGLSGEALASIWTLTGFAIGSAVSRAADAVIAFVREGIDLAIERSEEAKIASDQLAAAYEDLQVSTIHAATGQDGLTRSIDLSTVALKRAEGGLRTMVRTFGTAFSIVNRAMSSPVGALLMRGLAAGTGGGAAADFQLGNLAATAAQIEAQVGSLGGERTAIGGAGTAADDLNKAAKRARGKAGGRGGGSRKKSGTDEITFEVDELQIEALQNQKFLLEDLLPLAAEMDAAFTKVAEGRWWNPSATLDPATLSLQRQVFVVRDLNQALLDLQAGGINSTTDALGTMIEASVAGENELQALGATLMGSFGTLFADIGQGMMATALSIQLIQSGAFIATPALGFVTGALLFGIGTAMKGFSSRASGEGGGNPIAGAVSSAQANFNGRANNGGDRQGDQIDVHIHARGLRGMVIQAVQDGIRNREIDLLNPAGAGL